MLIKSIPFVDVPFRDYVFKNGYLQFNSQILGNLTKPVIKTNSILENLNATYLPTKVNAKIKKIVFETNEQILAKINDVNLNFDKHLVKIPSLVLKTQDENILLEKSNFSYDNNQ